MAIRTINYDVSLDGINPAAQQFGGVQGDHNVTELKFTLDTSLMDSIRSHAGDNRVVYRFDGYDGSGNVCSTVPAVLSNDPCVYRLE